LSRQLPAPRPSARPAPREMSHTAAVSSRVSEVGFLIPVPITLAPAGTSSRFPSPHPQHVPCPRLHLPIPRRFLIMVPISPSPAGTLSSSPSPHPQEVPHHGPHLPIPRRFLIMVPISPSPAGTLSSSPSPHPQEVPHHGPHQVPHPRIHTFPAGISSRSHHPVPVPIRSLILVPINLSWSPSPHTCPYQVCLPAPHHLVLVPTTPSHSPSPCPGPHCTIPVPIRFLVPVPIPFVLVPPAPSQFPSGSLSRSPPPHPSPHQVPHPTAHFLVPVPTGCLPLVPVTLSCPQADPIAHRCLRVSREGRFGGRLLGRGQWGPASCLVHPLPLVVALVASAADPALQCGGHLGKPRYGEGTGGELGTKAGGALGWSTRGHTRCLGREDGKMRRGKIRR